MSIDNMKTFSKEQVAQSMVEFLTTTAYTVTTTRTVKRRKPAKNSAVVAYKQQQTA